MPRYDAGLRNRVVEHCKRFSTREHEAKLFPVMRADAGRQLIHIVAKPLDRLSVDFTKG